MKQVRYKCPYCLQEFRREEFNISRENNLFYEIRCPNRTPDENGRVCNKVLPLNFFDGESKVISIVGGVNAGKTYYSMALLNLLLNNNELHKLGISGCVVGSEQLKNEIAEKQVQLSKGVFFENTKIISTGETLVLQVKIGIGENVKFIYLAFYDNPGEGFNDIRKIIKYLPNVYLSDGLIFLIEPKQTKSLQIHASINSSLNGKPIIDDLYNVFNNIIEVLIHSNKNRNAAENLSFFESFFIPPKIKQPIAICISKFDEVEKMFPIIIPSDYKELDTTVISNQRINYSVIEQNSREIKRVIFNDDNGDFRLKNLIESSLKFHSFFGVQSIKLVDKIPHLNPKGASLPLFWLFKQLNLI